MGTPQHHFLARRNFQTYCKDTLSCTRLELTPYWSYVHDAIERISEHSSECAEIKEELWSSLNGSRMWYYDWDEGNYGWSYPDFNVDWGKRLFGDFGSAVDSIVVHEGYHLWKFKDGGDGGTNVEADMWASECTIQ